MTASALAGELGLPLFSVLLHGILTKFMGEAAAKLRLIFDAMSEMRGVYLFDEIDALGAKRDSDNDVGEASSNSNSFLQFLEQDHSEAIYPCHHQSRIFVGSGAVSSISSNPKISIAFSRSDNSGNEDAITGF